MGLSKKGYEFYEKNITAILTARGGITMGELLYELRRIPQGRYPIAENRIKFFLRYMKAEGKITYNFEGKRPLWSLKI
jgi:hypothetical protein